MKKANAKHFSASNDGINSKRLMLSSIFGVILGLGAFLLTLLIFSAVCMLVDNPHSFISPLSVFAVYSSAFLAGLFAVKKNNSSKALLCGGLCGLLFMLAMWGLLSLLGYALSSAESAPFSFIWKLIIIPVSILGSFAGTSSKSTSKKRKF